MVKHPKCGWEHINNYWEECQDKSFCVHCHECDFQRGNTFIQQKNIISISAVGVKHLLCGWYCSQRPWFVFSECLICVIWFHTQCNHKWSLCGDPPVCCRGRQRQCFCTFNSTVALWESSKIIAKGRTPLFVWWFFINCWHSIIFLFSDPWRCYPIDWGTQAGTWNKQHRLVWHGWQSVTWIEPLTWWAHCWLVVVRLASSSPLVMSELLAPPLELVALVFSCFEAVTLPFLVYVPHLVVADCLSFEPIAHPHLPVSIFEIFFKFSNNPNLGINSRGQSTFQCYCYNSYYMYKPVLLCVGWLREV